jgi:23S rRNA pseudouridine1911/1915/1917 synthase
MSDQVTLTVEPSFDDVRLDRFVAEAGSGLTRARVAKLIAEGRVIVDGRVADKPSQKVAAGSAVTVTIPDAAPSAILAEDIPLTIVYEDASLLVIDKPAGMVVHPAAGHREGTLVNAVLAHCGGSLSGVGGVARPGIVHRLDKLTSGLIMVAKSDAAHHGLAAQLKSRALSRTYLAVVKGIPKEAAGVIDAPIGRDPKERKRQGVVEGGRTAVSRYVVLQRLKGAALVQVALETGRTHQVRVHMRHLGHPVLGDVLYSRAAGKDRIGRQALHAWKLTFVHPVTGETMSFTAPPPPDILKLIQSLGGDLAPLIDPV